MEDYQHVLSLGYNRLTVIFNNIGYVHYEKGQFVEALSNFDKSIALCPYHVRAYYNRSTVWEQLQDWSKAIEDYDSILRINPEVHEAYYFRSKCFIHSDKKAALRDCLSSLSGNKAHIPSLFHLYELRIESGDLEQLFVNLDSLVVHCSDVYDMLKALLSDDREDEKALVSRYPSHSAITGYGKTKREKEMEKHSRMLYFLHLLRGQLFFLRAKFSQAQADFAEMKKHSVDEIRAIFYTSCLEELHVESIGDFTLKFCKEMIDTCHSKRSLENFVRSLEMPQAGSLKGTLPTPSDQIYFLACFVFRRVHLHNHGYEDKIVENFWRMLKRKEEGYDGLHIACSDPFILTTLFKGFVSYRLAFTPTFLSSFQELLVACTIEEKDNCGLEQRNFFCGV